MMLQNHFDYHVQHASMHLGHIDTTMTLEARNTHRALSKWHMTTALTEGVGFVSTCVLSDGSIFMPRIMSG
ncbi:hypothetical protein [Polymorphobacter megasporae]|uniref:hypothetical protein n=1 Tax=Glacieibacterium megasporae TaxID=2835787 RepID=UPI001C1DFFCE|nr:hypothetical protein [Polymorphobacter megasporae]UAJ12281.1 hypothetical protein KTC28_20880 [Polymorphobacter megasporae]